MSVDHRKLMEILDTFTEAREAAYTNWPDRYPGQRAMGCFCTYVPEEIIHAAGFVPVRIRSSGETPSRADAHLQSYTCALCRSGLDQALRGDLSFLQGMVLPHTCDTIQALTDIWHMSFPDLYVETIVQPVHLSSPSTRPYLIAELQRFRRSLERFIGQEIADQAITASIGLYNEKRRLLAQLYDLRDRLTAPELFAATNAGFILPPEQYNPLLSELVGLLVEEGVSIYPSLPEPALSLPKGRGWGRVSPTQPSFKGPGLILAGAVLDDPAILNIVEELDTRIVGDDLCTGSRYFAQPAVASGDPITALADRYLHRLPCPAKYNPEHQPGEHLLKLVSDTKADGVVFVLQKFCDPHAFDYAMIKEKLDAAAVPHLRLEMEHTPALDQWRTRLQAFLEIICHCEFSMANHAIRRGQKLGQGS
ncbi:MAG: 2-hydroxyacyl-CoA dehydratase [Chloroflexi bacterium]|nr:2-hydroxyacyl-CoA dehydratase [Chloroflexota bacterium]